MISSFTISSRFCVPPVFHHPSSPRFRKLSKSSRVHASGEELSPLVALECDGILVDLHSDGHRVAFNNTFSTLGLECANWTEQVYYDLARSGDGTEESLIRLFFDTVGWPSTVATKDYDALVSNICTMKRKELKSLFETETIKLRSGVLSLIDEILESEAKLAVLTCTQSDDRDQIWKSLAPQLGDRIAQIRPIQWPEFQSEELEPFSEDSLRKDIRETKKKEAEAFMSNMNARAREKQAKITIDASLLNLKNQSIDPTFFLSMAASFGATLNKTVVVAAHNSILQSAAGSGTLCVAVPSGLSHRQGFPAAEVIFDGFGAGGGITWMRLQKLIENRKHV